MPDGSPWPRISIVTPSFNQAQFLEETIRSVLLQGYPNLEYIIVDGGSTDGSVEIIRRYEPWLAYWISEKDHGQVDALKKGFARATGDLVAWLNSDDSYRPGVIGETVQRFAADETVGAVYSGSVFVDASGHLMRHYLAKDFDWNYQLLRGNSIPQPSVFMRRRHYEQVGGLDESFQYAFDYELWFRFALRSTIQYAPGIWANYRLWENSKTISQSVRFLEEKIAIFGRLIEDERLPEAAKRILPEATAIAHLQIAEQFAGQGDWPAAMQHLEAGQAIWPAYQRSETWRRRTGELQAARGFDHFYADELQHVLPAMARAVCKSPRLLLNLGIWSVTIRSLVNAARRPT